MNCKKVAYTQIEKATIYMTLSGVSRKTCFLLPHEYIQHDIRRAKPNAAQDVLKRKGNKRNKTG